MPANPQAIDPSPALPSAEANLADASVVTAIHDVKRWLERAVIGLNLCPFAKAVHVKGQIHFAVSSAIAADKLLKDLEEQADQLLAVDSHARETTLLIAPWCLQDFLDFNAFLGRADRLLARRGLDAELQIASFHPRYQFADAKEDDVGNFTNRAPYPVLHLLREASVARAVGAFADTGAIYGNNLRTLAALGRDGWDALGLSPGLAVSTGAQGD